MAAAALSFAATQIGIVRIIASSAKSLNLIFLLMSSFQKMRMRIPQQIIRVSLALAPILLVLPLGAQSRKQAALEKQLAKRVQEVYQLFVSGDWDRITPYISEDTRSIWTTQPKSTIDAFQLDTIEVAPDGKSAKVNVMTTFRVVQVPGAPFHQGQKSDWVYGKGRWFLKIKRPPPLTNFFKSTSNVPAPGQVTSPFIFTENPVKMRIPEAGAESVATVRFQNVTPLPVTLENLRTNCSCLRVTSDIMMVHPTVDATLTLTYKAPANLPESPLAVQATVLPLNYALSVPVVLVEK